MPDPVVSPTPPIAPSSPIVAPPSPPSVPVSSPAPVAPVVPVHVVGVDPEVTKLRHVAIYGGVGLVETVCSAFDLALLNGSIAFPHQWAWVTLILQPVLVYITMTLPKLFDSPGVESIKDQVASA